MKPNMFYRSIFGSVLLIPLTESLSSEDGPYLPSTLAYSIATSIGNKIYVAGGTTGLGLETAQSYFWSLDLSEIQNADLEWQRLPSWPGPIPANHVTTTAVRGGDNSVLDPIVIASGEVRPRVRSPKIWSIQPVRRTEHFSIIDFSTIGIYLAGMIGIGVYFMYNMTAISITPFVILLFLPFFRKIDATSAYAYLERRFNRFTDLFAGVFTAAQSTISTRKNSMTTALVTDFMRPLGLIRSERTYLQLARVMTVLAGVLGTSLTLLFASSDIQSLWDQFMKILGLFGGSLCGLFCLGIFTTRTNDPGAIVGALGGAVGLYLVQCFTNLHLLMYHWN